MQDLRSMHAKNWLQIGQDLELTNITGYGSLLHARVDNKEKRVSNSEVVSGK